MTGGERRLAAIMFTDIVGYTHLSQANESLALELLAEHRDVLRPTLLAHRGTEVKTIGDAFLLEFKSALDAVLCAVEMQKKLGERNKGTVPARRVQLRIGIHVGDVVSESGDIQGDAVNVASRIEPLAEPGGICISQQVYDQIRNKTALAIDKVGDVELKNVDLPMAVYKIDLDPNGEKKEERSRFDDRLAVLPFVNISPDPTDEYFADGLTEELIAKLSEVRGLKVIARTSVMSYKRKDKKVSEIARELGVGSVIEGSVRKAGNRVRISVQLIDPRTEEHLWSSNYDSELNDIFAIQSDVASKVAGSLSPAFFPADLHRDTKSIEAYTLYLRAMQLSYDVSEQSAREVVFLLQRAISKDPSFARAYAGLSEAWRLMAVMGYEDFAEMTSRAEVAAKKALEFGPKLAESHSAMAGAYWLLDRFDDSLAEAESAVRLNPNLSEGYVFLGLLDMIMRTPEEALSMFRKAYELDPLATGTGELVATVAGWLGKDELVHEVFDRIEELNTKNPNTYLNMADYYVERKDFAEAERMIDRASELSSGEPSVPVSRGLLFALSGRTKEAEEQLKEIRTRERETTRLYGEVMVLTALGRLDEVFPLLMKQAEAHSWHFAIRYDPLFAEVRKDPRFADFCREVGIPASAPS